MAKALLLVFTLIEQEIDVVEQELPSLTHRHHSRRASGDNICCLGEDPGIAKDTATNQHATDTGLHSFDDLLGLDAITAAEDRNRASRWQPVLTKLPVGPAAIRLLGRPAVDGDCRGAGVLDHPRQRRRVSDPCPSSQHASSP